MPWRLGHGRFRRMQSNLGIRLLEKGWEMRGERTDGLGSKALLLIYDISCIIFFTRIGVGVHLTVFFALGKHANLLGPLKPEYKCCCVVGATCVPSVRSSLNFLLRESQERGNNGAPGLSKKPTILAAALCLRPPCHLHFILTGPPKPRLRCNVPQISNPGRQRGAMASGGPS